MWSSIGAFIQMIASVFGIVQRRQDLNNSTEMQRAAQAKKDQEEKDRINRALKDEDEEEIRRRMS